MLYQNDSYTFTLQITHANGTNPSVTTPPVIQIIQLQGFVAMLGSPAAMVNLDSSKQLWAYTWNIGNAPSGQYQAIVSYAADSNTFSGFPIEKITVGDTRILGTLALDATVSKDATVAKDSTVAKSSDLSTINPNNSSIILAIKSKTDNLPADPAGMTLLGATVLNVADVHDAVLGNQTVDKTQNPAVFTLKRLDNSVLSQYQLADDASQTSRTKI